MQKAVAEVDQEGDGVKAEARLEVRWMVSGELACVVDTIPTTRMADVRSQVYEKTGVPVEQQWLYCGGTELQQQADLAQISRMSVQTGIQLVRCLSDPRNTNRAHFSENLHIHEGPVLVVEDQRRDESVGSFTWVRRIGDAIYGEVAVYKWSHGEAVTDVAVKRRNVDQARQTIGKDTNEWTAHQTGRNVPNAEDTYAEIGVLQYLSRQPDLPLFLLKAFTAFLDDSKIWLVMELAEQGELLDAVLANRVAVNKQRQYVWQMLQAVSYLHKHNIGHRDISLENLLLHQDTVRLMDYGNAVQSHSMTGQELRYFLPVGKDTYRAPECFIPLGQSVATVTVPPDAGAGDLILHRNYHSLYQVRLPGGAKPGQDCQAELWGYAVQPADVFSCGVCFFCMCYGNGPWMTAQLTDEFFAYVYANQNGVTDRAIDRVRDHLYEAPEGDVRVHRAYPGAQGLVGFMAELGLREEDLTVDFLECRAVPWVGKVAASICSPDFANFLLGHFCRRFWQSPATVQPLLSCLFTHLGMCAGPVESASSQEPSEKVLKLTALNMRHNFRISPMAVVHGGCGLKGLWELPEKTYTILHPGDRLIFASTEKAVRGLMLP
ncbi:unnamed protein product [Effrenium voratum]|nr:unnamed protein product [Effrenium voratum]